MTSEASSPEFRAADRGTYIGLLRDAGFRSDAALTSIGALAKCCADRPEHERAYTCTCGDRWRLTQDGWINLGGSLIADDRLSADGDRLSPWEA
jgi:hypothetical protein